LLDDALKKVIKWGDVDRDALLEAAKALVALVVGCGGVDGLRTKQLRGRGDFITGTGLLRNVGLEHDARYPASAAVVAVAAAVQSHLDAGNYNGDAVRRSLTALCLSGRLREVLPTVAEATELRPFVAEVLELDLDLTFEQTGLVGAAFGMNSHADFANQMRDATVVDRALHIGHGLLELLLDDKIDVDGVHEDIVLGRDDDEGEIYKILSDASEIEAKESHAFAVGEIPVLDTLLERVESAMERGDAALCVKKARAVLEACAGVGKNTRYEQGKYELEDIYRLSRPHNAALGVASACLAVLLHARDVDPDVANALMASICAAGKYLMLVPSAMKCEKIELGASLLDSLEMMPEKGTDSAAILAFWMKAAAQDLKCDDASAVAERLLEEAIAEKTYDPLRRVRESELDRETGKMPETDDGPDEGDRYGANPWWLKDLKELFKKKKKQAARMGPAVDPSKANLPLVKQLATMPLAPVTTKAPPPYDLNAEFEKLFRAPKRRAGAYGDKKKSPAKPREDPTKKTKAKDDNPFSILNEPFGGGDDADTAAARDLPAAPPARRRRAIVESSDDDDDPPPPPPGL